MSYNFTITKRGTTTSSKDIELNCISYTEVGGIYLLWLGTHSIEIPKESVKLITKENGSKS